MVGLTGLVLAISVPVATVQDRHKFEECSGAETNLVYKAFLLGRDSIDVTVNHPAFPKPVAVNLQKSGKHKPIGLSGCYDAVRNRINDIAENPEKYRR